jgi:hypothetical protein
METKEYIQTHEAYKEGEGQYQILYNFLSNEHDRFFDHNELEDIIRISSRADYIRRNTGLMEARLAHCERERAFHEQWIQENKPVYGSSSGWGLLHGLFANLSISGKETQQYLINDRDRKIVATIIQWLGTNIGMCFLSESLARFGYAVVKKESKEKP